MCGRYSGAPVSAFKTWGLFPPEGYKQSFNITPQTYQAVIIKEQRYKAALMRWGLIPHWNKGTQVKFSTINARMETIDTSPAFRDPFYKHRCLVPTIGFYEWKRLEDDTKQSYFIHLHSRPVFFMAGIWDEWKDVEGQPIRTFSIVTCPPNDIMAPIHNRMPVIIPKQHEDAWVSSQTSINTLKIIMQPYDSSNMTAYRVSNYVNDTKIDNARLIEPYVNEQETLIK